MHLVEHADLNLPREISHLHRAGRVGGRGQIALLPGDERAGGAEFDDPVALLEGEQAERTEVHAAAGGGQGEHGAVGLAGVGRAEPGDNLARHRARRGKTLQVVEEPGVALGEAVEKRAVDGMRASEADTMKDFLAIGEERRGGLEGARDIGRGEQAPALVGRRRGPEAFFHFPGGGVLPRQQVSGDGGGAPWFDVENHRPELVCDGGADRSWHTLADLHRGRQVQDEFVARLGETTKLHAEPGRCDLFGDVTRERGPGAVQAHARPNGRREKRPAERGIVDEEFLEQRLARLEDDFIVRGRREIFGRGHAVQLTGLARNASLASGVFRA